MTKIKCLNALVNRIKFGASHTGKDIEILEWKKPGKNGFISDRTFDFLHKILEKAMLHKNSVEPNSLKNVQRLLSSDSESSNDMKV